MALGRIPSHIAPATRQLNIAAKNTGEERIFLNVSFTFFRFSESFLHFLPPLFPPLLFDWMHADTDRHDAVRGKNLENSVAV
jgi:hypothetical protein